MPTSDIRFSLAGLEVALTGDVETLGGFYPSYPSDGGDPGLVLEIDRVPGFGVNRPRGPEYPAFRSHLQGDSLVVERFDAEGRLALGEPVRGRFRVGDSPNSLEAVIRIGCSVALPRRGALIFHASAIAVDEERALLFAGVSGAGKSTIAAMLDAASPRWSRISDELVVAARDGGAWRLHVTPFIGGRGLPHGTSTPLAATHLLVQAPRNERQPVPQVVAIRELLRHVLVYAAAPETAAAVLDLVTALTREVPCYRLAFRKDPDVAEVLGIT